MDVGYIFVVLPTPRSGSTFLNIGIYDELINVRGALSKAHIKIYHPTQTRRCGWYGIAILNTDTRYPLYLPISHVKLFHLSMLTLDGDPRLATGLCNTECGHIVSGELISLRKHFK